VSIYGTRKEETTVDGKRVVLSHSVIYCDKQEFDPYDKNSHFKDRIERWDDIKDRKVKRWTIYNNGSELVIKI
jgi:hypothetical protein